MENFPHGKLKKKKPHGIYKNLYTVRSNREKEGYACDKACSYAMLLHCFAPTQSHDVYAHLSRGLDCTLFSSCASSTRCPFKNPVFVII
jgi:hypothetical protein